MDDENVRHWSALRPGTGCAAHATGTMKIGLGIGAGPAEAYRDEPGLLVARGLGAAERSPPYEDRHGPSGDGSNPCEKISGSEGICEGAEDGRSRGGRGSGGAAIEAAGRPPSRGRRPGARSRRGPTSGRDRAGSWSSAPGAGRSAPSTTDPCTGRGPRPGPAEAWGPRRRPSGHRADPASPTIPRPRGPGGGNRPSPRTARRGRGPGAPAAHRARGSPTMSASEAAWVRVRREDRSIGIGDGRPETPAVRDSIIGPGSSARTYPIHAR